VLPRYTPNTYLYLTLGHGKAIRYGIGVGREESSPAAETNPAILSYG
jgi:lipoprotein-anchoring transpeptidase ErfK/SrfK